MTEKIIIAGFGGQGVLTTGLIMAEAAVHQGLEATFIPSYGAEMRGGTANCNVVITKRRIANPVVEHPDILVALNEPSLNKFLPSLKKGGFLLINSDRMKKPFESGDYDVHSVALDSLAFSELKDVRAANMIALGVYLDKHELLQVDFVKKAIESKFGNKGQKIVEMNYKAVDFGMSLA